MQFHPTSSNQHHTRDVEALIGDIDLPGPIEVIPVLSESRLAELVDKIKPIVRFRETAKGLKRYEVPDRAEVVTLADTASPYYIEPVDPRTKSFTWEPVPTEKAEGLVPVFDLTTFHRFGSPSVFNPSLEEVLAQIPEKMTDNIIAIETRVDYGSSRDVVTIGGKSYHRAITTLYGKSTSDGGNSEDYVYSVPGAMRTLAVSDEQMRSLISYFRNLPFDPQSGFSETLVHNNLFIQVQTFFKVAADGHGGAWTVPGAPFYTKIALASNERRKYVPLSFYGSVVALKGSEGDLYIGKVNWDGELIFKGVIPQTKSTYNLEYHGKG